MASPVVTINSLPGYEVEEEEVTCFGSLPPYKLPHFRRSAIYRLPRDIYNANDFTLQEFCAKGGGKPPTQNVNAICTADSDHVWFNGPRFYYNNHLGPTLSGYSGNAAHRDKTLPLETARNMAYCLQRCFCTRLLVNGNPPPRPWGALGEEEVLLRPNSMPPYEPHGQHPNLYDIHPWSEAYLIQLHDLKWSSKNIVAPEWSRRSPCKIRRLNRIEGLTLNGYIRDWNKFTFTIDLKNEIICGGQEDDGWTPPILLPQPWTNADFPTIQRLCAVSLSGGNRNANAGGYCDPGKTQPDVAFTDEMTPWLGWTWDSIRQSATVRFYCWSQCRCRRATEQPSKRPLTLVWYWLSRTMILNIDSDTAHKLLESAQSSDSKALNGKHWRFIGHTTLSLTDRGGLELVYFMKGRSRKLLLCDTSGRFQAWPEHLLGPRENPVDLTENPFATHSTGLEPFGAHHITCESPVDCMDNGDNSNGSPQCIATSSEIQRYLGFDAVVPALGVCLSIASSVVATEAIANGVSYSQVTDLGRLGGRSIDSELPDLESIEVKCYCNATFVAEDCCYKDEDLHERALPI